LAAAQVAPLLPASVQWYPHMGTLCPSGKVVLVGAAVRLTVCACDAFAVSRRAKAANPGISRLVLDVKKCI
jgi:hypothetical protein